MGWNSTVVILHDALHQIENDPEFGKKLGQAIRAGATGHDYGYGLASRAFIVASYHADQTLTIEVGGNTGRVVPTPPPTPKTRPHVRCPLCERVISVSKVENSPLHEGGPKVRSGILKSHSGNGTQFCDGSNQRIAIPEGRP